jgi:hypothetical protein
MFKLRKLLNTKETVVCKLCLEPIYNFICVNCLHNSVLKWLSSKKLNIKSKFEEFHRNLADHFSSIENKEFCIRCRKVSDTAICIYCYSKEIFWWLFEKNKLLAKEFSKVFNLDFLGTGYLPGIKTRNLEPIITYYENPKLDFNLCENCSQVSDNLKEINGAWLCESCRD